MVLDSYKMCFTILKMKMLACAEYRQIAGFKNQNMSRVGSLANEFKISVMKLEIAIWFNHFLQLCMQDCAIFQIEVG